MGWIRRLFAAEGGSIIVMAAMALTAVMGMSGLAVEVGTGYAAKVRNQRVADMAAVGAALAYRSSSQDATVATQVAKDIVVANGLPSTSATVTVPVSINGTSAVKVEVKTGVPVKMASLITQSASYDVKASAAASFGNAAGSGCVTALSASKTAIDMGDGAALTATGCAVTTNGTVSLTGGAQMTTQQVVAQGTSVTGGASITTAPSANNIATKSNGASDTIKNQGSVKTALCYVNQLKGTSDGDYADGNTGCTNPLATPVTYDSSGGSNWDMTWSPSANVAGWRNGGTYTVPASSTEYVIDTLTVGGGISVTFSGPTKIRVNNIVVQGGGSLTIGDGSVIVTGTLTLSGGTGVTMGNGYHSFGGISISGGSFLKAGTGSVNVSTSIDVGGGGSQALFAPSTGETVVIGDTKGTSISIAGGSIVSFDRYGTSAATGGFSASGGVKSSGGSSITFNKAATHVIDGDLDLNGSSVLGSGLYVIAGDFSNNTGGTMSGTDVTFALGGSFRLAGGTSLDVAAPSTSSGYGIQDVLLVTKTSSDVFLGGGTADKYSGVVYAPKAQIKMAGGASLSGNGSQCLMMVVDSVSITGGASFNTANCPSQTGSAGAAVALIQ